MLCRDCCDPPGGQSVENFETMLLRSTDKEKTCELPVTNLIIVVPDVFVEQASFLQVSPIRK